MSHQNVALVMRSIEAVNQRDVDGFMALNTTDFELLPAMSGFAGVSFHGREGVERYFAELDSVWEEFQVIGEELHDLGDRVLVLMRIEGRGRGSGVRVVGRQAFISDFRDGKTARVRSYLDRAEALRDAGLEG
jgi:ketosteroid isomerase-like protein